MATVTNFDLDNGEPGFDGALSFTENNAAKKLAANALVSATGNFDRQTLTISGLLAEDQIGFASGVTIAGSSILISHSVYKEAGERLCVRPIDDVTVKGRRSKVPIYELMGVYGADDPGLEPTPGTQRLCKVTRLAYDALVKEDYALAARRYREILAEFPDDPVASTLIKRLVTA